MISQTMRYAIRAILLIAERDETRPLTVRVIAEELGIPQNYLSKTLHRLVGVNVLRSVRGPGGGFRLSRPASEITLGQLSAAIESGDGQSARRCLLGNPVCSDELACAAHKRWCTIADTIEVFFNETTLADLGNHPPDTGKP